jgi:glycosyltransferase involved in cell wall biosynthesis
MNLSMKIHLINKIKLLGKVDNLYQILKFADVFLLPSEQESFGLAALEAMAAETPVISSNAGGIPEVNIQGETGFLAEVGNVEAMASYAIKLLSDDKLSRIKKKLKQEHWNLTWSIFFRFMKKCMKKR